MYKRQLLAQLHKHTDHSCVLTDGELLLPGQLQILSLIHIYTKSDYCQVCGFDGEIVINDDNQWECPCCHNKDRSKMNVTRRTCGYLGENYWNVGKTKEIKSRVCLLYTSRCV